MPNFDQGGENEMGFGKRVSRSMRRNSSYNIPKSGAPLSGGRKGPRTSLNRQLSRSDSMNSNNVNGALSQPLRSDSKNRDRDESDTSSVGERKNSKGDLGPLFSKQLSIEGRKPSGGWIAGERRPSTGSS